MTKSKAKNIPIPALLEKLGFQPDRSRQHGNDLWFPSPFRKEAGEPCFHVNLAKNVWYDFGAGSSGGGDIFDLVMSLQGCDLAAALVFLEKMFPPDDLLVNVRKPPTAPPEDETPGFQILETSAAFAPALFQYLQKERCLNLEQAREFVRQIHFQNATGRRFFGIGLQNRAGGWEVQNPYFKGCIGQKDLSFFPGKNAEEVSIFEGMFDFLSALTWYGKNALLQTDVLVLNSLAIQDRAVEFLRDRPQCQTLKIYLRNDTAGEEATANFRTELPDRVLEPCFALYLGFDDFNDFLVKNRGGKR